MCLRAPNTCYDDYPADVWAWCPQCIDEYAEQFAAALRALEALRRVAADFEVDLDGDGEGD